MVKRFIEDFILTDKGQFTGMTASKGLFFAIKAELDANHYLVYAHPYNRVEDDLNPQWYYIIGIAKNDDSAIRFFSSKTLRQIFTPEERLELQNLAGTEFVDFQEIIRQLYESIEGKHPEIYTQSPSAPLVTDTIHPRALMEEAKYYVFSHYDEEEHLPNEIAAEADSIATIFPWEDTPPTTDIWIHRLIERWLSLMFEPAFPHFDMSAELQSYIRHINTFVDFIRQDKNHVSHKYLAMSDSARPFEKVIVHFIDRRGNSQTLPVYGDAFRRFYLDSIGGGEPDMFIDLEPFAVSLKKVNDIKDCLFELDSAKFGDIKYGIPWENITALEHNGTLIWKK